MRDICKIWYAITSVVLASILVTQASAQTDYEFFELFKQKSDDVIDELRKTNMPEWAGIYTRPYMNAVEKLYLAPETGYAFVFTTHIHRYSIDLGSISHDGDILRISTKLKAGERVRHIPNILYPIKWGNRHYVVAESDMLRFANYVNLGREPSTLHVSTFFLLKDGDENKPVSGKPVLPARFARLILDRPIKMKIIETSEVTTGASETGTEYKTVVRVDGGRNLGVWDGMTLIVPKDRNAGEIIITNVGEKSSTGYYKNNLSSDSPRRGTTVKSRY
jgi:hypothetical protein